MKVDEPKFYHEAAENVQWREAMNEEIEALNKISASEVVDLPQGKNPIIANGFIGLNIIQMDPFSVIRCD